MILSLTIQFLCISFLSYSQAHIGAIKLFFLDTPLNKIRLLGSSTGEGKSYIEGHLSELTCMGHMVRSPVFSFSLIDPQENPGLDGPTHKFDLLANLEDVVDTWGPGEFIVPKKENPQPVGLVIGGGTILAKETERTEFHWSQGFHTSGPTGKEIDPQAKIIIGTPVLVNKSCPIDEDICRHNSSSRLPLGGQSPRWERDELQVGIQLGPDHFMLQANAAQHKVPGRTLKQYRLQQPRNEALVPLLNNLWGLQVSFCTGVSRRVPLREMVADMLPIFAEAHISLRSDYAAWVQLRDQHQIVENLRSGHASDCLRSLPDALAQLTLEIIRDILATLKETGIDPSGKYMVVAWPQPNDPNYCFQVPCKGESAWTKVLADSEDCATFAYVTTLCLQTETFRCQGSKAAWQNVIPLLETAVIRHNIKSKTSTLVGICTAPGLPSSSISVSSPPGPTVLPSPVPDINLKHNEMHFFQKLDGCFFVAVQRPDTTGIPILVPKNLPSQVLRRVQLSLQRGKQNQTVRLRERIVIEDIEALDSFVASTSSGTST